LKFPTSEKKKKKKTGGKSKTYANTLYVIPNSRIVDETDMLQ
jgi:hypothetical protein